MNATKGRLIRLEILTMFILSLFFFMGCIPAQPTNLEPAAASFSPGPASLIQTELSNTHATTQPSLDWALIPAKSFDGALLDAANSLLALVELPLPGEKRLLLIDSPIDGITGMQSVATRKIESRLGDLVRKRYPHFSLQPFTPAQLQKSPLVLIGTLTPINGSGGSDGRRDTYGGCLALADLKSGTVVSKQLFKAEMHGVNHTPTTYFQESPIWMNESFATGYVHTCDASKPGDRIQAKYLEGILSHSLLSEAIALYESGQYSQALERYTRAAATRAGDQLRAYNGIYLANLKLRRTDAAAAAFGNMLDYGMAKKRLAINFLFQPGRATFASVKSGNDKYSMWVNEIARRARQSNDCLEIIGHTSRSGPETANESLSLQRAEYIRKQLETAAADLAGRVIAQGAGSRENLVGTGRDDMSDALDRRVAFQVLSCADLATQTAHR